MRTTLRDEIPDEAEEIFIHCDGWETGRPFSTSTALEHVAFQVDALDWGHLVVERVEQQIPHPQFASVHLLDWEPFCNFPEVIAGISFVSAQIPTESLRKIFETDLMTRRRTDHKHLMVGGHPDRPSDLSRHDLDQLTVVIPLVGCQDALIGALARNHRMILSHSLNWVIPIRRLHQLPRREAPEAVPQAPLAVDVK